MSPPLPCFESAPPSRSHDSQPLSIIRIMLGKPAVRLNEHIAHPNGAAVFHHACKLGAEGIVSKRLGSRYRSGRSPDRPGSTGGEARGRGRLGTMSSSGGRFSFRDCSVSKASLVRSGFGKSWHRGLVERCHRHGSEARTSGAVRSPCRHSLSAAWLERHHCLRLARHAPKLKPMASRDRGHPLYAWHALSCFAALTLSQRDLARFCAGRGKLSLFGGPRLFAVGLILVMPAALRSSSESN